MTTVKDVCFQLEQLAPLYRSESWDNTGLLVGSHEAPVKKIMTCLTITDDVLEEATKREVDLIVTHHPLPFRGVKKITSDTPEGAILLGLIQSKIAVFSAHTAFDSAEAGINQQFATRLGLTSISFLRQGQASNMDAGKLGSLPIARSLQEVADAVKEIIRGEHIKIVGDLKAPISKIAIGCGSAGELISDAIEKQCDLFVTGEISFHRCLEASARGLGVLICGHYYSEKFGLSSLVESLSKVFPQIKIWDSIMEKNPVRFMR